MRFVTAVALAAVMLWVPVDGVAQRPVIVYNISERMNGTV